MLEKILILERSLFLQLNQAHTPFGDWFFYLFSNLKTWIPLVICFLVILFYKNRSRWKEMLLIVAAIAVTITLCDQFASGFCKPFFARLRPTHHPDFMNEVKTVFDYRGGRYGFISSHAANGFGFAMFTSLIFRKKLYSICLFLWATISAYSRIYLGVHFISDIIPGILVGIFFGWAVYKLFVMIHKKLFPNINQTKYPNQGINIILALIVATIMVISISYVFSG